MGEGRIAKPLADLQSAFPDVAIGSYPTFEPEIGFTTTLVLRSRDEARLVAAETAVKAMLEAARAGRL